MSENRKPSIGLPSLRDLEVMAGLATDKAVAKAIELDLDISGYRGDAFVVERARNLKNDSTLNKKRTRAA